MYKVIELIRTCGACPSQWEGKLSDGQELYIRFRWGALTAQVDKEDAVGGLYIYDDQISDPLDGYLDDEEMMDILGHLLDFSNVDT